MDTVSGLQKVLRLTLTHDSCLFYSYILVVLWLDVHGKLHEGDGPLAKGVNSLEMNVLAITRSQ